MTSDLHTRSERQIKCPNSLGLTRSFNRGIECRFTIFVDIPIGIVLAAVGFRVY